jgi:hypothetical protein
MPKNPMTQLSNLAISPTDANEKKTTGLYVPILTNMEINSMDNSIVRNGGIIYNNTTQQLQVRKAGFWKNVTTEA